ncbi:hypothetical protein R1sor_000541 [Riccia sorocarpa]|uniref:Reverse transcriptase domain-containing protein n=1 Tax=Riccia sorocarpa TaxID=122646 RepID=A0ABD3GZE3_9MARC
MSSGLCSGLHDLRVSSWNIGGMKAPPRKYWLRSFIRHVKPHIIAVQEWHISQSSANFTRKVAAPEYKGFFALPDSKLGGVVLFVHKACTVVESYIDPLKRFVWVLVTLEGQTFGVIGLYSPTTVTERRRLWSDLAQALTHRQWILVGDLNMTEFPEDSSGQSQLIGGDEATQFSRLKAMFSFSDARKLAEELWGPKYTRFQHTVYGDKWSVLDRFYISALAAWMHRVRSLLHHADYAYSDHFPVTLNFQLIEDWSDVPSGHQNYFKVDPYLLADTDIKVQLEEMWAPFQDPNHWQLQDYLYTWGQHLMLLQQHHQHQTRQLSQIETLEAELQKLHDENDGSEDYSRQIQDVTAQLHRLRSWQHHRAYLFSIARHLHEAEASTRYFHRLHRKRAAANRIRVIQRPDGSFTEEPTEILQLFTSHFQSLYNQYNYSDQQLQKLLTLLEHTPQRLSQDQQAFLQEEPSALELDDLVRLLPSNKAPGKDALTAEGLREQWSYIRTPIGVFVRYFWGSGFMPSCFLESVIRLLPKVDSPVTVGQWRPIALLTLHYKIVTKLLALRLAVLLPTLVPSEQAGFIRTRSSLDNILSLQLAHEYLKKQRQHAAFLKLDFEKAYDKVAPQYLLLLLDRLNCGSKFISLVRELHTGASATILADGFFSPKIHLFRGVRQGCPLAPLLFVLLTVPLINLLKQAAVPGRLQALKLTQGVMLVTSFYADDAAVFLRLHRQSFHYLRQLLDDFCDATGGHLNLSKSELVFLGADTVIPPWVHELPLKVIHSHDETRYLGYYFSQHRTFSMRWSRLLQRLQHRPNDSAAIKAYLYRKWNGPFLMELDSNWWRKVFSKPYHRTDSLWIWRFMFSAYFNGETARRFKLQDTACHFCHFPVETLWHLLFDCPRWCRYWAQFRNYAPRFTVTTIYELITFFVQAPRCPQSFSTVKFLIQACKQLWRFRCEYKYEGTLHRPSVVEAAIQIQID